MPNKSKGGFLFVWILFFLKEGGFQKTAGLATQGPSLFFFLDKSPSGLEKNTKCYYRFSAGGSQ